MFSKRFKGHTSSVLALIEARFSSPETPLIVSGGKDNSIHLWEFGNDTCVAHKIDAHDGLVRCLAIWGRWLVSGGDDPKVKLWPTQNGCRINDASHTLTHRRGWVLSLHPSDRHLFSGGKDGCISIWNEECQLYRRLDNVCGGRYICSMERLGDHILILCKNDYENQFDNIRSMELSTFGVEETIQLPFHREGHTLRRMLITPHGLVLTDTKLGTDGGTDLSSPSNVYLIRRI